MEGLCPSSFRGADPTGRSGVAVRPAWTLAGPLAALLLGTAPGADPGLVQGPGDPGDASRCSADREEAPKAPGARPGMLARASHAGPGPTPRATRTAWRQDRARPGPEPRPDLPPRGKAATILSPRFFPGWQARDVCHPFVVVESPGRYRMYYSGSGAEQHNESVWDQWVTGQVASEDTLTWRFPDSYEPVLFARRLLEGEALDPVDLASRFDSVHAVGACVVRDGPVWRAWYTGWSGRGEHLGGGRTRKVDFRIGHATSRDGLAWVKSDGAAGLGAVLGLGEPGQPDAKGAAHPHVLAEGGAYRMWYEGFDGSSWTLLRADSPDGLAWTKRGPALGPGGIGSLDELGLRNPLVLSRKGRYELWYQGRSRLAPSFHVLRAVSSDGIAWTKAAGEVSLHPDPPISGDEQVLADSAIVLDDGSVQVFFARQVTTTRALAFGSVVDRNFHICTEIVDP